MKTLLLVGKLLTAVFWGGVLLNLLQPFNQPFTLLFHVAGGVVLLMHALELWLFDQRIAACAKPHWARLWVMLFGIFHLAGLSAQATPQNSEQNQNEQLLEAGNA